MKKILLILALLFATVTAQAEFPYATTTWGSTEPIQWYYITFDGTPAGYLYALTNAQSGFPEFNVKQNSYANTDAYKWCFVQMPSGRIALVSKLRMQYLNNGFHFTFDTQSFGLNYVVQDNNSNSFYICFDYLTSLNTTIIQYLKWDGISLYPAASSTESLTLHAEAASVETYSNPAGQINFSDLDIQDESCSFTCAYSGNESHTLKVYIDGTLQQIASSYTFERTNQAQQVTVRVEVFFNGNIFPIYAEKTYQIPPLNDIELTFTPYNVNTPNNGNSIEDEDYHKLFDKDRSTKWCVDNTTGAWDTIWVDFMSNHPIVPTGYTMTTGNDTYSWKGRNPKKWKIYAKAHETDEWTTIVDVTDGDAAGLGTDNTTDYSFNIDGVETGYQYFRFEVSEVRGQGGWQNNHYVFQLAELALTGEITTIPEETQAGILTVYDGNATSSFVPVYGLYADAYNKCQMIMPASELSDMVEGTISKLTWYLASPAVAPWGGYFQIYLSEVSQTTLPSLTFLDISGATLVYEGDLDGTGETMEIEFTQDYTYGGGNLLISVFEPETGHWKAATFAGTTVEGASTSGYSYSAFEECIATQRNFLPKTTFTYAFIDYPKPKNLTATGITSNGATLTWEAGGDETSWGVEYKKAADEEWTSAGTVTEKTITLDALDNGVKYDVRVKSIYADGESEWVQISFSTPVYEGEEIDITLTPTTAYIPNNDNSNEDEDYHKLFDKDRSTKWCVVNASGAWQTIWVDFKSNVSFIPTSYTMTTGNDTYQHRNRNPNKWKIYAKAHESDEWTTIVDVTDGAAAGLGVMNTTDYSFDTDGIDTEYQFFRFEVSEIGGKDDYDSSNYVFQLAELAMKGYTLNTAAVAGDSNGDNRVDVNDVTTVINHILGKNPSPFNANNADVNGDGNINVMDVTLIINIILGIS